MNNHHQRPSGAKRNGAATHAVSYTHLEVILGYQKRMGLPVASFS